MFFTRVLHKSHLFQIHHSSPTPSPAPTATNLGWPPISPVHVDVTAATIGHTSLRCGRPALDYPCRITARARSRCARACHEGALEGRSSTDGSTKWIVSSSTSLAVVWDSSASRLLAGKLGVRRRVSGANTLNVRIPLIRNMHTTQTCKILGVASLVVHDEDDEDFPAVDIRHAELLLVAAASRVRVVAPRDEDTEWASARDRLQDTRRGSSHQPEIIHVPATTTAPPSSRATCQGSSKKGNACTAKAQLGSKFCGNHAPGSSRAKGPTERATHKPKQRDRKDSGCDSEEPLFKN